MRSLGYMRSLVVLAMSLIVATSVTAQDAVKQTGAQAPEPVPTKIGPATAETNAKGPVAVVDEMTHNFGDIWVNNQLKHAFTITNTGDAPLKIIKVKPSCGCTVAGQYPKEIAPGASGKFPFSLNTKRVHGKFTKSISVTTNDPKQKNMRLKLTGQVKHHVEANPRIAQFGRVQADSVLTRKITLTNNTETPLNPTINKSVSLGCFSAEIEEAQPGKVFEVTITAQPPFKDGINRATLKIDTNINQQKTLDVICMATMPKRIEVRPDRIQLAPHTSTPPARRVTMTNNGKTLVNVLSATATDEGLTVETKELEPGKRYQFTVNFSGPYEPTPASAVVVKTDDPKMEELRIPIRSIARKPPRQKRERPAMTMLGKPAPQHEAAVYGGSKAKVGGKNEKIQFVTFYASWCGFCKRALPKVEELYGKYKSNENVEFVAVNLDDRTGRRARTEEQTVDHYEQLNLSVPLILDSEKKIGREYKVTSFPTMFVLGKSGEVEAVHVGAAAGFEKAVSEEIDLLLAGKTRADFPTVAKSPVASPRRPIRPANVKPASVDRKMPPKPVREASMPKNPAAAKSAPAGQKPDKEG